MEIDLVMGVVAGVEIISDEKAEYIYTLYKYFNYEDSRLFTQLFHDDVIKWTRFPRHWPFVRGIHRSPVNFLTNASDAKLWCFLWSAPEQMVEQTVETPVIWHTTTLIMTPLQCCPG